MFTCGITRHGEGINTLEEKRKEVHLSMHKPEPAKPSPQNAMTTNKNAKAK